MLSRERESDVSVRERERERDKWSRLPESRRKSFYFFSARSQLTRNDILFSSDDFCPFIRVWKERGKERERDRQREIDNERRERERMRNQRAPYVHIQ